MFQDSGQQEANLVKMNGLDLEQFQGLSHSKSFPEMSQGKGVGNRPVSLCRDDIYRPVESKKEDDQRIPSNKTPLETVVILNECNIETPPDQPPCNCSKATDVSENRTRGGCLKKLEEMYESLITVLCEKKRVILKLVKVLLVILWLAYLIRSVIVRGSEAVPVILITAGAFIILLLKSIKRRRGKRFARALTKTLASCCSQRTAMWIKRALYVALCAVMMIFVALDTSRHVYNLTSFGGLVLFVLLAFITSTHPFQVKWRPVLWGFGVQFPLALVILRWESGYQACRFLGDQVRVFADYSDAGAKFVFGKKNYLMHPFVFKVLPVVVFFSSVISVLYHWGVIQAVVQAMAWVLRYTMGTTPVESLAAAAHIFLGQLESSILLKPFFPVLTMSELHAVLTTGYATIAGAVMAVYIDFGADPEHLLAASFMSAPAALALAKLNIPETEESVTKTTKGVKLKKSEHRNVIEAASSGAANSVKLMAFIVVNVIAFLAILEFLNTVLVYLGDKVGVPGLTFQVICSYLFMPLAAVMGVPWEDTGKVGTLIGTKIVINEFVAYSEMGAMIDAGQIQRRTVVISTYVLCGFGNILSLGITLGMFSAVAPSRRSDVSRHMVRAMILSNVACFTTACIAGMLYNDYSSLDDITMNSTSIVHNRTIPR